MKKFVTDSNAVAQEKALDAVLAFVTNAHVAGRCAYLQIMYTYYMNYSYNFRGFIKLIYMVFLFSFIYLFIYLFIYSYRTAGDCTSGIVQKCLAAPKRGTQEKANEVLLMYCEIEKYEVVQEELMKGFAQKNPKVVAACVRALTTALR